MILLFQQALFLTAISVSSASSWVDPQTPKEARTVRAMGDRDLTLVFSDEFEDAGRTFHDGADTRWTAEDRPGTTNAALQYYNSSHVSTKNGKLTIQSSRTEANWVEHNRETGEEYYFSRTYTSGLVSTWDKFCFTSGMIEISFQLPGDAKRGGLWPAFWMLGNLARPSYMRSTEGIWPWSYNDCGSSQEAIDARNVQKISNCQYGKGRGSPEIDIIEAQPGDYILEYPYVKHVDNTTRFIRVERPMISSSLQVSPGVSSQLRPFTPDLPGPGQWYPELFPMGGKAYGYDSPGSDVLSTKSVEGTNDTGTPRMINNYWYGQVINQDPEVWQDGLSVNWHHDLNFYEKQVVLRTEWQAGKDDGYVRWYNGDELIYEITADTMKNKPGAADAVAQIPYEAMYLILNTDISPRWGWNGCDPTSSCMLAHPGLCSPEGELLCRDCADPRCLQCPEQTGWLADFCEDVDPENPAEYKIDYVRVYQDTSDPAHTLGCSPPDYPTKDYIEENWDKYTFDPWIEDRPLHPVQHGGGSCKVDADCGNLLSTDGMVDELVEGDNSDWETYVQEFGGPIRQSFCVQGRCQCPEEWTGPNCLSPCLGEYGVCEDMPSGARRSMLGSTLLVGLWFWVLL